VPLHEERRRDAIMAFLSRLLSHLCALAVAALACIRCIINSYHVRDEFICQQLTIEIRLYSIRENAAAVAS